jgi:tetratricopeptide (TPR) repeat protein
VPFHETVALLQLIKSLFSGVSESESKQNGGNESASEPSQLQVVRAEFRKGDYEAALWATDKLRGSGEEPDTAFCYYRGVIFLQMGRYAEAERLLRLNLKLEENQHRIALGYSALAQLLTKLQRYDEAIQAVQAGLRHWPSRGGLHRDLAEAVLRRGDNPEEALQFAKRAVEDDTVVAKSPGSAARDREASENLATLAWVVAAASNDAAEVTRLVERAIPLAMKEPIVSTVAQVHYHSGLAYATLGNQDKCIHHFEQAFTHDPNGLWGREARSMALALSQ